MVKIITDSSSLYTQEEAREMGFASTPLQISIDDWDGEDLLMDMDRFYRKIEEGHHPKSSQPAIGEVLEAYKEYADCDVINITMADGLSGTYQSACGAKEMIEDNEYITVFNSKTLCGPHRYFVDQAVKMAKEGKVKEEILAWLEKAAAKSDSFLIPQDFGFLRRGGRLTPLAATMGGVLRLKPILHVTPDGKRLDKFGVKRTMESAGASVAKYLEKKQLGEQHIVYVSHANVPKDASRIVEKIKERLPKTEIIVHKLSPAFVTQGGPGCVAIQYNEKI